MIIKKLDNLFLPAHDFEASKDFYANLLKLDVKFNFSDKGLMAFRIGTEEPALILKDLTRYPATKPTLWFEVPSAREAYKELLKKNIDFLNRPFRIRTGWAVEFRDPSGNILGFTDYIKD